MNSRNSFSIWDSFCRISGGLFRDSIAERGATAPIFVHHEAMRNTSRLAPLILALAFIACASHAVVTDTLYFGTETPSGTVSAAEWQTFVDEVVTPRFPQGFTVTRGEGQWRGPDGRIVHESSYILQLVHADFRRDEGAIAEIAAEYKARFHQDAVLRVRTPAHMTLF
jgi:hypothetical protein